MAGVARYALHLYTAEGHVAFGDPATVRRVREIVRRAATQTSFVLSAYCFLPSRLELLVEAADATADPRRFVELAKQRSGFDHRRRFGRPLWRVGYVSRAVPPDEPPEAAARHVLLAPRRDGLVGDAADYPFMGSDRWSVDALVGRASSAS